MKTAIGQSWKGAAMNKEFATQADWEAACRVICPTCGHVTERSQIGAVPVQVILAPIEQQPESVQSLIRDSSGYAPD